MINFLIFLLFDQQKNKLYPFSFLIKKILKPFKINKVLDFFLKNFSNKLKALLLLLLLSSSCTDQGCIEADDFGEYEYQTLEVLANNSA
ncbi:MAG: hypothetical protein FJ368_06575, partial [Pelagibacterales bacterium]|nr:hypothetical protein [Pelagibacterales bacterium]